MYIHLYSMIPDVFFMMFFAAPVYVGVDVELWAAKY